MIITVTVRLPVNVDVVVEPLLDDEDGSLIDFEVKSIVKTHQPEASVSDVNEEIGAFLDIYDDCVIQIGQQLATKEK